MSALPVSERSGQQANWQPPNYWHSVDVKGVIESTGGSWGESSVGWGCSSDEAKAAAWALYAERRAEEAAERARGPREFTLADLDGEGPSEYEVWQDGHYASYTAHANAWAE